MIYLDNSATTKPYPEALAAYTEVASKIWGNPSSLFRQSGNPSLRSFTPANSRAFRQVFVGDFFYVRRDRRGQLGG